MGRAQVVIWQEALESVQPGQSVLVISHGRMIEAGLVEAIGEADFATWGPSIQHCEGVRLRYGAERLFDVRFMRLGASVPSTRHASQEDDR